MASRLKVVLADDERPARAVLAEMIEAGSDAEVVGEAATGPEAVSVIERLRPDLALLDLEMPEMDGLEVARVVRSESTPLFAFVTAYDEYAVRAFEVNAVDYLLKPVAPERLLETFRRARQRLAKPGWRDDQMANLQVAFAEYERSRSRHLDRLPVRKNDDVVMVPTEHIVSAVAEGELLHLTTGDPPRPRPLRASLAGHPGEHQADPPLQSHARRHLPRHHDQRPGAVGQPLPGTPPSRDADAPVKGRRRPSAPGPG